ncbi:hypothetical protein GJ496_011656 [Pomphorhynchus laevis]|nr:hypothetical protein GJ496_011656 [Pomphorhynchus laevis]
MSAHVIYDTSTSKEDNQLSMPSLSKTDNAKISTMTSRTTICSKHKFNKILNDSINQVSKCAKTYDDDCKMLHSPASNPSLADISISMMEKLLSSDLSDNDGLANLSLDKIHEAHNVDDINHNTTDYITSFIVNKIQKIHLLHL